MKRTLILAILATCIITGCKKKKPTPAPQVKKIEVKEETKPLVEEVEAEPVDEGVNIDNRYFIIVNSYAVSEFAYEKMNQYKKQGYKPKVLMRNDNGFFCLALKSFDDYNLALNAAEELRKVDEFSEAWILSRSSGQDIEDKVE